MKRIAILVAAITFTISINTQVFAVDAENSNSISNETNINDVVNKDLAIMPDSIFYLLDKGIDNLKLFLNFDDVRKTEMILQIANERLAEYADMTAKEKYDLAKDMIKELDKLNNKLDSNAQETIETQLVKREAVANMVEKKRLLNAARQEYQLVKISLEQAKKSGDEAAIKVAEELLKEKESLYKVAIEEFKIAFKKMQKVENDLNKRDKNIKIDKAENKEQKINKVEDDKNVKVEDKIVSEPNKVDEKLIKQNNSKKITQVAKVICIEKKDVKQENKNILTINKVKKVAEVRKEIKHNNIKEKEKRESDKKVKRGKLSERKNKEVKNFI